MLRRRFSAKGFVADCRRYNVTVVQYIGELCRYLMLTPPTENDDRHKVSGHLDSIFAFDYSFCTCNFVSVHMFVVDVSGAAGHR